MFHRFNEPSRRLLFFARVAAYEQGAITIEPEHLLEGVLRAMPDDVLASCLPSEVNGLRDRFGPSSITVTARDNLHHIQFGPVVRRVLRSTGVEADALGHESIEPGHVVLALLAEAGSVPARWLAEVGIDREAVVSRLGSGHS